MNEMLFLDCLSKILVVEDLQLDKEVSVFTTVMDKHFAGHACKNP